MEEPPKLDYASPPKKQIQPVTIWDLIHSFFQFGLCAFLALFFGFYGCALTYIVVRERRFELLLFLPICFAICWFCLRLAVAAFRWFVQLLRI